MIYYLTLVFAHGGSIAIPEPDLKTCQTVAAQVKDGRLGNWSTFLGSDLNISDLWCVPGLPQGARE